MTKDEELAMDLALEALELTWDSGMPHPNILQVGKAITAIKQARSAPVQEPVGVYGHCPVCGAKGVTRERRPDGDDRCANGHTYKSIHATTPPVAQRQWVGLTDEERKFVRNSVGYNQFVTAGEYAEHVQKATEAKLKEKNT
jgi:hypothetical protein